MAYIQSSSAIAAPTSGRLGEAAGGTAVCAPISSLCTDQAIVVSHDAFGTCRARTSLIRVW
jgi:hypothetical protein